MAKRQTTLEAALEQRFDVTLAQLPAVLRRKVQAALFPIQWDDLSAGQRLSAVRQWDQHSDPEDQRARQSGWELFVAGDILERNIAELEGRTATSVTEIAAKERELKTLRTERDALERRAQAESPAARARRDEAPPQVSRSDRRFIPFPRARKALQERLDATSEEIAAWIWMGPTGGGICAFLNANDQGDPRRFYFDYQLQGPVADYLAPLMACWFDAREVEAFTPVERFMTGQALIDAWGRRDGIVPEAFIRAKVAESRLTDLHPIFGGTVASSPGAEFMPSVAQGLFPRSEIDEIEATDFGDATSLRASSPSGSVSQVPATVKQYLSDRNRAAANAMHDLPGGSRDKRAKMRAIWASGKYSSRDRCAEEEHRGLDMGYSVARRALVGAPEPPRS